MFVEQSRASPGSANHHLEGLPGHVGLSQVRKNFNLPYNVGKKSFDNLCSMIFGEK